MQIRTWLPIASSMAFLALPVHAQWYVGATAGQAKLSHDSSQSDQLLDLGFDAATTSFDDKDSAYRIHGGYRFHRNFAVELGYVNLGRYSSRSLVLPTGSLENRFRVEGVDVSAVGLLPLNSQFTVYGRVGLFASRTRASYAGTGSVVLINGASSQRERTQDLTYGVGAMYNFSPRFSLVAEISEYRGVGSELTGGELDIRTISAGLVYRF
ncbi:MAG: outer membrane beta-barrel protein [Usitatibacter sp.]